MRFDDRSDAGRQLARRLLPVKDKHPVILGLPRGGIPVAHEVAQELGAPLDVIVVRKLGVPFQPELGFGAIGEQDVRVIDDSIVAECGLTPADCARVEREEREELLRRVSRYREGRPPVPLAGRTVVIVDDGVATGSTAAAACQVVRSQGAAHIILAVPVGPAGVEKRLSGVADYVVCLSSPAFFGAVGAWYEDFSQTRDDEVIDLLARAAARTGPPDTQASTPPDTRASAAPGAQEAPDPPPPTDREVELDAGNVRLSAQLTLPESAAAVVAFAHGSGSSRHSPRNRYVAEMLNAAGLGTLLLDLLTPDEESDRANVFDTALLADRLAGAGQWLHREFALPLGYFGASTGAAAALQAAAPAEADIGAVVSRGGRPDLAEPAALAAVTAPTLLIVGSRDTMVLDLNRQAAARLRCPHRIAVVPGATHLFTEPGTLARVAELASDWFTTHLTAHAPPHRSAG